MIEALDGRSTASIHLVISYDPEVLELDDEWRHQLSSLANDGLDQMRSHLLELEERIPWNAVDNVLWEVARPNWLSQVSRPGTAQALGRALLHLETVMLPHAFSLNWQELRAGWRSEVVAAATAWRLRELLLAFEGNLRWLCFYMHDSAYTPALNALLNSSELKLMGHVKKVIKNPPTVSSYQRRLQNVLHQVERYSFDSSAAFCAETIVALEDHAALDTLRALLDSSLAESGVGELEREDARKAASAVELALPRHLLNVAWLQGGASEKKCTPGVGDPVSLRPPLDGPALAREMKLGAERAAARQRSHRWAIQSERHLVESCTRTLLVYRDDAQVESLAGMLALRPYDTLADVRLKAELELQLPGPHRLFRARVLAPKLHSSVSIALGSAPGEGELALEVEQPSHPQLLPLLGAQDHKVAHLFFPHAQDVLVVRQTPRSDLSRLSHSELLIRPRGSERLLCLDLSAGAERNHVPVYNGADEEPAPLTFSYVSRCVALEGVRLLALYDEDWLQPAGCSCTGLCQVASGSTCVCVHNDSSASRYARAECAYEPGLKLKRGFESIYECHALCACDDSCPNRVVQRGVAVRLEIFRTARAGWAVRSVDSLRKGTFICEYAGEHLPDDEAEERGMRYDQRGMSRLMDVQGDGEDAMRMCVDATNFSNLARFINHSCAPNCHKQRVFADHHTRLPRVALFSLREIGPLEEISYDYGYLSVPGQTLPCHCGARTCKTKLY